MPCDVSIIWLLYVTQLLRELFVFGHVLLEECSALTVVMHHLVLLTPSGAPHTSGTPYLYESIWDSGVPSAILDGLLADP